MPTDYFPNRKGDLGTWEANFQAKITAIATTLGFTAAEVTALKNAITAHQTAYQDMNVKAKDANAATQKNNDVWKQTENMLRKFVQQIKSKSNYTEEMGKSLGIVGSANDNQTVAADKPILTISLEGGAAIIKFKKQGRQGIKLYSKRGNEAEFTFLATDTYSPYTDNRQNLTIGQPEKREYYAYFLEDDEQVGNPSDMVAITVL